MITRIINLPQRRSCLLLGPRQTGKTTLVRSLLPPDARVLDLLHHDTFLRYAKDPSQFRREMEAKLRAGITLVFVDEVQRVPALLDEIHSLIESHHVRFILTGASARKLRRSGTNSNDARAVRSCDPHDVSAAGGIECSRLEAISEDGCKRVPADDRAQRPGFADNQLSKRLDNLGPSLKNAGPALESCFGDFQSKNPASPWSAAACCRFDVLPEPAVNQGASKLAHSKELPMLIFMSSGAARLHEQLA